MRIASILTLTALGAAAAVCNAADNRDFERTVPAEPHGSVEISNVSGETIVTGWDRPEVVVRATLGTGVDRVDVNGQGGRIIIKVVPRRPSHDGETSLEVRVPKESELDVTGTSSDIVTSGMLGPQRLKSVSGDVRAELANAGFEAKTVSGDLRLRGNGKEADMRVETVSGDVSLERGAGDMDATTVSGDLRLDLDPAHNVRMHTTSGDLTFNGKLVRAGTLEAETISGDATLKARSDGGYEYEAMSFSGDIDNCFGEEAQSTSRHGPGTRLNGSTGDGKARVRVKSMSGDVSLCNR